MQPGTVCDPCCGSGGMFVQSAKFVDAHGGNRNQLSIYGQEFTNTTWQLAKMNLALHGIDADLGAKSADSFTENLHPDLRVDFIIASAWLSATVTGIKRFPARPTSPTSRRRSLPRTPKGTTTCITQAS
ncbi:MAG: N-6 DNA methylase [Actinomycetaceae bacterium]|nr:N-6 DNA methylase [Actinomycetaceae bacterium]